jgi:hypothetical protein
MGWVRVDLYNLIPMSQHNPNPTSEHKFSPLIVRMRLTKPGQILKGN